MKAYRIVSRADRQSLSEYLTENGQILQPMIEGSRMAIDELIDVLGRASIETVLQLSAQGVAGEKQRGRAKESIPRRASGGFWDIRISGCSRPSPTTWSPATPHRRFQLNSGQLCGHVTVAKELEHRC